MNGNDMIELGAILIALGALILTAVPLLIHVVIKKNNSY